jgi:hypothetical protein
MNNMSFHNTCPKKGVVCDNVFPPPPSPNQRHGHNMGKANATPQLLNFFTIGKISIIYNKKSPWNIFVIITTPKIGLFV